MAPQPHEEVDGGHGEQREAAGHVVATLWGRLAAIANGRPCVTAVHSAWPGQRTSVILANRVLGIGD